MDKNQVKPRKDKKKNTQTGLLMGQNTNIFSQLSATYLQNKTSNTEQQDNFVKSTQIIQYHDPKINRLIALLRKKADVTKAKAAVQLRQQFQKMTQENLQEFIPTFAQLFLETVVNQQSKQVIDQFIAMINSLLEKNKKIAIRQIATFYGPLLIINRPTNTSSIKTYSLLFSGNEEQLHQKALTLLLMKKQVFKKFIVFCRSILQCDEMHKVTLQNYQRNCAALMKVIKDFSNGFQICYQSIKNKDEKKSKQLESSYCRFLEQINEIFNNKCIDQYFKVGGKAKGSIIQMYQMIVKLSVKHPEWKLNWQKYAKIVCQNYLDKDYAVQQNMWKNCNKSFIECCLALQKLQQKDDYSIFIKYLPKPEQKLLQALKIGGLALYKQLPSYVTVFPSTIFSDKDQQTHKSLVGKVSFIKKLMNTIINQLQDENQARMECYYQLTKYFIRSLNNIKLAEGIDEKKTHQINLLSTKCSKQLIQNLQTRFYKNPPTSRNSFTYNLPSYFCKLLEELHPQFDFIFDENHTFTLYKQLNIKDEYCLVFTQKIFTQCKTNKLILTFLENFPSQDIEIGLEDGVEGIETNTKIFLLSKKSENQHNWFQQNWDEKAKLMVYDPRITEQDLMVYQQRLADGSFQSIQFNLSHKNLPKIYDSQHHNRRRIDYFIECLQNQQNQQAQILPIMVPMLKNKLIQKNKVLIIQRLIKIFEKSSKKLQNKQWVIGQSQVMRLRIITDLLIDIVIDDVNNGEKLDIKNNGIRSFIEIVCSFTFAMFNYKLWSPAEQILKKINKLTFIRQEQIQQSLFTSIRTAIKQCYYSFKVASKKSTIEEKHRRNRLDRCLEFIRKLFWYGMGSNRKIANNNYINIFEDFVKQEQNWVEATYKSQVWEVLELVLMSISENTVKSKSLNKIIQQNIDHKIHNKFLSNLCGVQHLLSLQRHPQTKRIFIQLQNQLFSQIQQLTNDKKLIIFKNILNESTNDQTMTLINGAENLLKNIMKNYLDMNQETLRDYTIQCLNLPLEKIKQDNNLIQKNTIMIVGLISELPLADIAQAKQIQQNLMKQIENTEGIQYLSYIAISAILWNAGISKQQITQQKAVKVIEKCLNLLISGQLYQSDNFYRYCILVVFNSLLSIYGKQVFQNFKQPIQQSVMLPEVNKQSKIHGAVQLSRFKFISKTFEAWSTQTKRQLMRKIPQEILTDVIAYKATLDLIEDDDSEQVFHTEKYENIINMFIESAEVIIKFAQHLQKDLIPKQSIILKLLQCPFAGIKRTSFILVKRMYQMKLVERVPPKQYLQSLKIDTRICKQQLDPSIANQLSKYFNSWQAIIQRKASTQKQQESQEYQLTLEDYLQQQIQGLTNQQLYYENFLKTTFQMFDKQLDYLNNEQQYCQCMSTDQLLSDDAIVIIEDSLNIQQKLYRIALKTLFLFVLNFPLFLKQFMDRNKKYKNICDKLLRNVISDAIFQQQIAKIQIKESQWKADGNFEIYVVPKNKEIYAEYIHQSFRVGLRLVMRSNFPITPIAIQFGEGLKMDQDSKWALMLQSQLHSRNNTIINGILLWRQNITKKLSGVEQCAICFDAVGPNGQLPNKSCKTCKKRFHSNCVMKWFNKSHKSQCPLCKSQFL